MSARSDIIKRVCACSIIAVPVLAMPGKTLEATIAQHFADGAARISFQNPFREMAATDLCTDFDQVTAFCAGSNRYSMPSEP